jgi:L-iditol 2-dehydrogenase
MTAFAPTPAGGVTTLGGAPLPSAMRALVLHAKEDLRFEERPVPVPGPGTVLLEVGSVGVCGSDKHFYFEGRASSSIVTGPVVLGHEFGGRVVALGPGAPADLLGRRVSVEPQMPCRVCRQCREGLYNLCPNVAFFGVPGTDGALQQYLVVPVENAFPIPDEVSDDAAAVVETISVSLWGGHRGNIEPGHSVLVTGAGPIGLFAIQVARVRGAGRIVAVEPQGPRRAWAAHLGAEAVASLAEVTGPFDVLMECTGVESVRHDAPLLVVPGGNAVLIGVGLQAAPVPMPAVIEREVKVVGVMRYRFTWPSVITAIARKQYVVDELVTRRVPFDDAISAWTAKEHFATEVKTIIRVNAH